MNKKNRFITNSGDTIMVRVPNCPQICFHLSDMSSAIIKRDLLCKKEGINPYIKNKVRFRIFKISNHKDQDLPSGINRTRDFRRSDEYNMIAVNYKKNNKNTTKSFSYGNIRTEKEAMKLAIEFRKAYLDKSKEIIRKEKEFVRKHGFIFKENDK